MSNNKQSSVEQFAIALYKKGLLLGDGDLIQTILDLHKAMHKDEIMDARTNGRWACTEKYGEVRTNIQYYKETYLEAPKVILETTTTNTAKGYWVEQLKIKGGNNEQ